MSPRSNVWRERTMHACVLAELRTLRFPSDMAGLIISYPLR